MSNTRILEFETETNIFGVKKNYFFFKKKKGVFEMCESLSDEYRGKARALLQKYRPIEDDTRMTVTEKLPYIEQWWRQSEQLLKGMCFHYEDIEKSIKKADVKLRYIFAFLLKSSEKKVFEDISF